MRDQQVGELSAETIGAIAERVIELLDNHRHPETRLVDAATVARHLGLNRTWVYEHAGELGGIRLGDGPRARLRFDLTRAREVLEAASDQPPGKPRARRPRRRRQKPSDSTVPLLPIRGRSGGAG